MGAKFHLTTDDATAILATYGISSVQSVTPIAEGSVNSTFKVHAEPNPVVITILERSDFDHHTFSTLTTILEQLAHHGAPVIAYLNNRHGTTISSHHGKPATVTPYIKGGSLQTRCDTTRLHSLGRSLAHFHQLQTRVHTDTIARWTPPWHRFQLQLPTMGCLFTTKELSYLEGTLDTLANTGIHRIEHGLIHTDVFPSNVVYTSTGQAILIDFEDARRGPLALDLAIAIISCCTFQDNLDHQRLNALISGYTDTRPLAEPEHLILPQLLMLACADILLGRIEEPTMRLAPRPMYELLHSLGTTYHLDAILS